MKSTSQIVQENYLHDLSVKQIESENLTALSYLVIWPKGSVGELREMAVVGILYKMAKEEGFGRISQLAQQIEEMWRNPDCVSKYRNAKEINLKLLEETWGSFKE